METVKKRGSGAGKWIAIGVAVLVLLSLGTCVFTFGGLFAASLKAQQINEDLMAQIYETGLPPADDPIYLRMEDGGWTQRGIDQLNFFIAGAGENVSSDVPVCTAHTNELTDTDSLDYVQCVTDHVHEKTDATSTTVWKTVGDDWKLVRIDYNLADKELAASLLSELQLGDNQN